MRRLILIAPVIPVLLLALVGCAGTSNATTRDEILRAVKKSVLTATDTMSKPISATSLEAAASEIEGYLAPLDDLNPQGDLAEPYELIVDGMDEILVALRAGNIERITVVSTSLAKVAVDVDIICQ